MSTRKRLVITGLGVVTPLGLDLASSWSNLIGGVSGVTPITLYDSSLTATRIAGEVKGFDPASLDVVEPKYLSHMDRISHLAIAAGMEAMRRSRLDMRKVPDPYRAAVLIGSGIGGFNSSVNYVEGVAPDFRRRVRRISPFTVPMITADSASANLSIATGALGPSVALSSACSTGADSIVQAAAMIQAGLLDLAVTGGVEACINPYTVAAFNACRALTTRNDEPQTASRPFDKSRNGFVIAEGAGAIVLESLESARQRGAEPLAELVGYSSTSDAHHMTQPHPQGEGAIEAMRRALQVAQMQPEEVSYINAHGTSTQLNDSIETKAIKQVFGNAARNVPISSTKSMTGHMVGAAGAVEIVFGAMAMQESVVPPTINLNEPDPACDLDYTPNEARKARLDAVMSNSFGFGGHNTCLIAKRFND